MFRRKHAHNLHLNDGKAIFVVYVYAVKILIHPLQIAYIYTLLYINKIYNVFKIYSFLC